MEKRPEAVQFKDMKLTLVGPELKAGDSAPDFSCIGEGLAMVNLGASQGKTRLFSVVPSLDTPVCSEQTKKFQETLASYGDQLDWYTVSLDLPFAQGRFCTAESITNTKTLSDVHNHSFGQNWGVLLEGLPLALLCRAIFVVDGSGKITHAEYVPVLSDHPNYDAALEAVKNTVG